MNFILEDVKVPDHAELRLEILQILSTQPRTAALLLAALPESHNKSAIATPQRLSRFLGGMANLGFIKAVKPVGGANRWSVLPQGAALLD